MARSRSAVKEEESGVECEEEQKGGERAERSVRRSVSKEGIGRTTSYDGAQSMKAPRRARHHQHKPLNMLQLVQLSALVLQKQQPGPRGHGFVGWKFGHHKVSGSFMVTRAI